LTRVAALVVAAALLLTLAASVAQARTVVGAQVNPNPNAVRAYWTPERMRTAIPKDVVRPDGSQRPNGKPGGGGSGGSGGGTATGAAALVKWPSPSPTLDLTYTNGKVFFKDGATRYVCSGTAINSRNRSVVWTAGHCVNNGGQNQFYADFAFVPGYNSGVSYPTFTANHLYTSTAWATSGEFGQDYGAAVVDPDPNTGTLQATLGGIGRDLGFTPDWTIGRPLDAYGYPAAGKFNGQSLYHCLSAIKFVDSADPNTMGIPCSMTGGSSGGAWLDPNTSLQVQVSNNSYGYQSLKNVMFGPVFGQVASDLFHVAEGTLTRDPDITG
jgi:hypothetical protein